MTFPTIPTTGAGRVLFNLITVGSGTQTFPNLGSLTKSSGDLLIAICVKYNGSTTNAEYSSWGGGFTEFVDQSVGGSSGMSLGAAYKWSDGTETGTFTVTTVDTTSIWDAATCLLSIPGSHASTPPEASAAVRATGAAAVPASLNPGAWDVEDTLWIGVAGIGETNAGAAFTGLTSPPSSYTTYDKSGITEDIVGGTELGVSFRQLAAASDAPTGWTLDISNARNIAVVIAVRPAAVGGGATASPATVTRPAAIPSLTVTATAEKTATTVNAPAAVPAAAAGIGATTTPATITRPVAIPAVTVTATAEKAPATVNALTVVPAATTTASATTTPATVNTLVAVPLTATGTGATPEPATVNLVAAVPVVTTTASADTTPATVNVVSAVPLATASGGGGAGGIAFGRILGTGAINSSGTTVVITTSATADIGEWIVVRVATDNLSATTPTYTCADSAGNTYTVDIEAARAATAGAGIAGAVFSAPVTSTLSSGGTITVTLSGATFAKAAVAAAFTGVGGRRASGATSANGVSTAPTVTLTTPESGDLVIGHIAHESFTAPSAYDTDTSNGSWSTGAVHPSAVSGTDNQRVQVIYQYKIVTGTGSQTFDATVVSADWIAFEVAYTPTAGGGATATPATVNTVVLVPLATVTATAITTPATVPALAAIPAVATTATAETTPATVNTLASAPAVTNTATSTTTPATVNAPAAVPAVTKTASSSVIPATVPAPAAVALATVTGGAASTATPATVNVIASVSAVTRLASSTVTPATVPAPAAIPAAAASGGSASTASPVAVTAVASVPSATVTASVTKTATTVNTVAAIPAVTTSADATKTATTVNVVGVVPAVVKTAGSTQTATPVGAVAAVPQAAASGNLGSTVLPATVTARAAVPVVVVSSSVDKTVLTVSALVTIPATTKTVTATVAAVTLTLVAGIPLVSVSGLQVIYDLSSGGTSSGMDSGGTSSGSEAGGTLAGAISGGGNVRGIE